MPVRVLILDDEMLLALFVAEILHQAGHEVVDMCPSADRALEVIARDPPDLAILDVNLGRNTTSEPVAHRLLELAIPFLFLSAYDRGASSVLRTFAHVPALSKPVQDTELLAAVGQLLTQKQAIDDRPALA